MYGTQYRYLQSSTDICALELGDVCSVCVTGSVEGYCHLWNLQNGQCIYTMVHASPVCNVSLLGAGSIVATCCVDSGCVYFWNIRKEELLNTIEFECQSKVPALKRVQFSDNYILFQNLGENQFMVAKFQADSMFNKFATQKVVEEEGFCNIL